MLNNIYLKLTTYGKRLEGYRTVPNRLYSKNNVHESECALILDFIDCILKESQNIYDYHQSLKNKNYQDFESTFLNETFLHTETLYDYILELKNFLHGFDYRDKQLITAIQHNVRTIAELRFYNCTRTEALPKIENNLIKTNRLSEPIIVSYPSILVWQEEVLNALFENVISLFQIIEKFLFQLRQQ
jgi:hypothetical protein